MKREEITAEQLFNIPFGSLFKVPQWDSDDFHEWTFLYIKGATKFIYLGGGMDKGSAIGKSDSMDDIIDGANGCDMPYIKLVEIT